MRIDILAIGSQGDVQPYVALGLGLRAAGYDVRMVTLGGFEKLVGGHGLPHLTIGGSPREIANTDAGRAWVEKRKSAGGFLRGFVRLAESLIEAGMAGYWNAGQDAEALIVSPMGLLIGGHIAERLCVPMVQAPLVPPILPTRYDWDGRRTARTAFRAGLNVAIDSAFHFLMWNKLRGVTNAARRQVLGLPPLPFTEPLGAHRRRFLMLAGYSPAVVRRLPDWDSRVHVTGYWFLDDFAAWVPPADLLDFLASGPPPVFVGFGSTPFPNPEATSQLVVQALTRAGQRGVVVSGGSGLATGRLSDNVLGVDSIPHGWLFPRLAAAVHHGGAGVTGAALRAGLPSVVVPVFADQPFWGNRVFQLGAGPRPIPAKNLTADNLTVAIQAAAGKEMRRAAAALGEQIRKEDGVARALEVLEKNLVRTHSIQ